MRLIKKCPACGRELRFPIDRGTIRVTCRCGHEFTADPDNTTLYDNARFDLTPPARKKKMPHPGPFRKLSGENPDEIKKNIINALLKLKYDIQNFRLLPVQEQRKLLLRLCVIAGIILLAVFLIVSVYSRTTLQQNII